MDRDLDIYVLPDGTVRFIRSDELEDVFAEDDAVPRRASHVEPCVGGWSADLSPVGGPVLGPYARHRDAIAAEVEWLRTQLESAELVFTN